MGRPEADLGKTDNNVDRTEAQNLSASVQTQAQIDSHIAAPSSAGDRMWDVTKNSVNYIEDGFKSSLTLDALKNNMIAGAVIGAATKVILPETGAVGKVAGAVLGAYFVGEPLVKSEYMAYKADNMAQMKDASEYLGNAIGGMPVGMVEGGIGAKFGSGLAGAALDTEAGAAFKDMKRSVYNQADTHMQVGMAGTRNFMFEKMGVGAPDAGPHQHGVIPPYLLESLAKNNPENPAYMATIRATHQLHVDSVKARAMSSAAALTEGKADRYVFDAGGEEVPGKQVMKEGDKPTGNSDVDNAYNYTGDVREYYKAVHNRNSIDGKGMDLLSTVNYGDNFENAFWDSTRMTYGRPGAMSFFKTFIQRVITGHEMTHGVTENEANETYRKQPGALNEHNSDVFGVLVEQRALGQTADKASWLVGEGIWKDGVKGRALRDMRNPGTAYDDPRIGKDPQPAHMKDYINTTRDNGGVHLNSGIPNKAFADFAVAVGGNAWEAPGKIWYEARHNAGSDPSFASFAWETIEAAKKISPKDVEKLQAAWEGVGVKPAPKSSEVVTPVVVNQDNEKKPGS
ncbi:MAG TPA: M4 family metallopeptidase [Drouetiella sp.]